MGKYIELNQTIMEDGELYCRGIIIEVAALS